MKIEYKPDEHYYWLGGPGALVRIGKTWLVVPLDDYKREAQMIMIEEKELEEARKG